MKPINESELSPFLKQLLADAADSVAGQVQLRLNDDSLFNVDLQTMVEDGNYIIYVSPETLGDEYAISHELLHLCAKNKIPSFVRVIEPNLIGMIGTELQGYLEHNWILAEQKRRGLAIDEQKLFADIESKVGPDEQGLQNNISRILSLNNLLRTFPAVLAHHQQFFAENCPSSLAISQRIMSHFPPQETYSNYEARKALVAAIREWTKVFQEHGFISVNLSLLLSVTPVFSANQLKRLTNVILGLAPKAILNNKNQTDSNILYTVSDGQCCVVFSMDEEGVKSLQSMMNKMTLEEFLAMAKIPYLMR